MSPFANALNSLRRQRGIQQQELAELLGCPSSYLSALENDARPSPPEAFVAKLCAVLELPPAAEQLLWRAHACSQRRYVVPRHTVSAAYELVTNLFEVLDRLSEAEIGALAGVLTLCSSKAVHVPAREPKIRRRHLRQNNAEAAM